MSKTKNDPVFKSNILQTPRIRTLTRAKKEEIGAVKAELKSQLAALTSFGVRRHRLPYHESVLRELEEAKFGDSVNILKMLYKKDDDFKKSEKVKKFKNQKHLIERVKIGLINAEVAKKNNEIISQSKYLLNIALFFESMTSEWHWIAHEFYKIALEAASAVPDSDDDGELTVGNVLNENILVIQIMHSISSSF